MIRFVSKEVEVKKEKKELTTEEKLSDAVASGNSVKAAELTKLVLSEGGTFQGVVNDILMPAMTSLGLRFEEGKVFLPSLVKAASAMNAAMDVLNETVTFSDSSKKKVTLATVYGDVHDIGKNIVKMLFEEKNDTYYKNIPTSEIIIPPAIAEPICPDTLALIEYINIKF